MMKRTKSTKQILSVILVLVFLAAIVMPMSVSAASNVTISGGTYPEYIKKGDVFILKGTVRSDSKMTSLTAYLYDSFEKVMYKKTVSPNSKTYNLKGIDSAMRFDKLGVGTYIYKIVIKNASGTQTILRQSFTVYEGSKDSFYAGFDTSVKYQLCLKADHQMVIDVAGWQSEDNVYIQPDHGQETSYWYLEPSGDSYYMLRNAATGCYMDVYNGNAWSGTNVWQYRGNQARAQQWRFVRDGDYFKIVSKVNQLVLDVSSGKTSAGTNIQVWNSNSSSAQRFWLKPQSGAMEEPDYSDTPSDNTEEDQGSKMLSINWEHIKKVGNQAGRNSKGKSSDSCFCFALAYSKTILDGKVHSWKDYDYNGYKRGSYTQYDALGWYSKANYSKKTSSSQNAVYKAVYDSINNGKPVIVFVKGKRSSWHYITIVGYENVTSTDSLSASNFLIIDSCPKTTTSYAENMGKVGYSLKKSGKKYQYFIAK